MTFKELKSGCPVFLFDRTTLKYEQGKIMSVSAPHADIQACNYGKMLVDITIQSADRQNTYSVNDTEQTAYAGSLLLSTDKEHVINEVRAINAQAEETLAKVDEAKRTISSCRTLLVELDTAYKEKQQTEQRFQKIDERFGGMEEKMDKILRLIQKGE